MECLPHCIQLQRSALVACTPLPPLTGFIFIHSWTVKFTGCSLPQKMWQLVTQGGGISLGGRVRGWGCETMDMSGIASTILSYVCPHLVDDKHRVKRQLLLAFEHLLFVPLSSGFFS